MSTKLIPDDISDIGPDWFNARFAELGIEGEVSALSAKSIGTGQIGENVRFALSYRTRGSNAPNSLVGKFPSSDPTSLATAAMLGHYRREVNTYNFFKPMMARIAPPALIAARDEATNRFVLLMHDMAPAEQGDQLKGCGVADAKRALEAAAVLHAAHWDDASLDSIGWLQGTSAAPPPLLPPEAIAQFWDGFKQRYADRITPDMIRACDPFAAVIVAHGTGYAGPKSLTHNDFRLDNMLFGGTGAPKPLAVVDWQTAGFGGPANDVAYFIGAGLTREERPKHERDLLSFYHQRLQAEGVHTYSLEDLTRDYRWFSFYGLSVAFGAAMLVKQTERGDEMFLTMMRRHSAQVLDNDALSLLPT